MLIAGQRAMSTSRQVPAAREISTGADGRALMLSFDPDTRFYRLCIAGRHQASGYCYELLVCPWFLLENARF